MLTFLTCPPMTCGLGPITSFMACLLRLDICPCAATMTTRLPTFHSLPFPSLPSPPLPCSATESMCLSLVQRVLDGQGLPWIKSSLEAAVNSEDHRTTMLKALQEKLGLRVLRKDQHSSNTCELNQVVSEVVRTTTATRLITACFSD